jgi:hypothetical protein
MKCYYCSTELPEPGMDHIIVTEGRLGRHSVCRACMVRRGEKVVDIKKVGK